jgi:hypothetical protein
MDVLSFEKLILRLARKLSFVREMLKSFRQSFRRSERDNNEMHRDEVSLKSKGKNCPGRKLAISDYQKGISPNSFESFLQLSRKTGSHNKA